MKHIHFIAIGGAIMHQLALALQRKGHKITGSDDEINDPAKSNLLAANLLPSQQGWFPEKINLGLDAVVLGMHAKSDNPELLRAQQLGVPIYSFPEFIFQESKDKRRVVIAGSHGKTTVTSMVMHILQHCGLQFDYMVGASVPGFTQSVSLSQAPLIILEGDEYPASAVEKRPKILFYHPHITVLNGISWDHINVFPTYENYCHQFEQYLERMEANSLVLYNAEDAEVVRLVKKSGTHLQTIPYRTPAFRYENGQAILETREGDVPVAVLGRHNLINLEAAVGVCEALGVERAAAYQAIRTFTGAARRLEKIKEKDGLVVYRDFAHAPSKLQATLAAVRQAYQDWELIACFELHTFSSLNEHFLKEYKDTMKPADCAFVYFSHHALALKRLPDLNKQKVAQYFGAGQLEVMDEKEQLEAKVKERLAKAQKPVCLLIMSSGTFDGIDWNTVSSQNN